MLALLASLRSKWWLDGVSPHRRCLSRRDGFYLTESAPKIFVGFPAAAAMMGKEVWKTFNFCANTPSIDPSEHSPNSFSGTSTSCIRRRCGSWAKANWLKM
jgi:hypothetical protein